MKRKTSEGGIRKSERVKKAPLRYRPNSELGESWSNLIHTIASQASKKSEIPVEPAALITLEEALEKVLHNLLFAALVHAKQRDKEVIEEEDLEAVKTSFLKEMKH